MLESRLHTGEESVNKLVQVLREQKKPRTDIKHCFVSTDDYSAIEEVSTESKQESAPCQVHTLTSDSYVTSRGHEDTLLFLSEMELLTQTTYFIGTFNSKRG